MIHEQIKHEKVRPDSPCASGPRISGNEGHVGPRIVQEEAPIEQQMQAEADTPDSSKKESQSWEVVNLCNACKGALPGSYEPSEHSS